MGLHSLDHSCVTWCLKDTLWYSEPDSTEFACMYEVVQVVRACFVDDLPGLAFNRRFSGSSNEFANYVYSQAVRINKKLADNMDCEVTWQKLSHADQLKGTHTNELIP